MIRRLVVLALLVGGAVLLEPLRAPTEGVIAPRSLLLFGILLLTADTFGALAHDLGFPRLVGYLVAGLALGPSATGIVPGTVLEDLAMMKRLAVGLIGLLAGAELRLADLRLRIRSILSILVCQMVAVLLVLWAAALIGRSWIPFLGGLEGALLLSVSLVFAATLTVNSPMVTLALLTETKAEGPLAKTTLGVVLVADVVVILIFTAAFSLAKANLGGEAASAGEILRHTLGEVFGSILAGALIGAVLSLYLRYVKRELVVFAVVLVFATAAAAQALGFELLLSLLVAGFFVENVAPVRAEPLVRHPPSHGGPGVRDLLRDGGGRAPRGDLRRRVAAGTGGGAPSGRRDLRRRHHRGAAGPGGAGGGPAWLDRPGLTGRRRARARHHRGGGPAGARHADAGADRGGHRVQRVGGAGRLSAGPRSGRRDRDSLSGRGCGWRGRLLVLRSLKVAIGRRFRAFLKPWGKGAGAERRRSQLRDGVGEAWAAKTEMISVRPSVDPRTQVR